MKKYKIVLLDIGHGCVFLSQYNKIIGFDFIKELKVDL